MDIPQRPRLATIPTYEEATGSPPQSPPNISQMLDGLELGTSIGTEGNRFVEDAFARSLAQSSAVPEYTVEREDAPPHTSDPPIYSPHLAENETRLSSNVHMDRTHLSAQAFTQLHAELNLPPPPPPETRTHQTGSKKMQIFLTRGAERLNENGTGPLFIRVGRQGKIEGRIECGKTDKITSVEVAVSRAL